MSKKTRIIYYFVTSVFLFSFGGYLLSISNSSKGAYAAIIAGVFQALIGSYLLYRRNKAKLN